MIIKSLNGLFFIAFVLSILVQFNDTDPLLWVAVYTGAALLCALYHFRWPTASLAGLLLIVSMGWIVLLIPAQPSDIPWQNLFDAIPTQSSAVEEAREMGGLLMIALWSSILLWLSAAPKT